MQPRCSERNCHPLRGMGLLAYTPKMRSAASCRQLCHSPTAATYTAEDTQPQDSGPTYDAFKRIRYSTQC